MRTLRVVAILCLVLTACRPDTVDLSYRFPEGEPLTYRMSARAEASWTIGTRGSGSYEAVFQITESAEPPDVGDGKVAAGVVTVTMEPVDIDEGGLPSPGAETRTFTLELGSHGEVLRILSLDGVPASALGPDQLLFIGTYRPPLPDEPVRLRDTWESRQELRVSSLVQDIVTTGELSELDRDSDGKLARLSFSGAGPLTWTAQLPQGEAELRGSAVTRTLAELDLEGGVLRAAESRTQGDFEVRVMTPSGRLPITGTLHLELRLAVEKIG